MSPATAGEWIELFNGRDLSGWKAILPEGAKPEDTWSWQDGVLVCKGQPIGYIRTERDYTNYALQLEWRFSPVTRQPGNSGVLLRIVGPDKVWPRCVEAQLQHENAGDFWNIDDFPMRTDPSRTQGRNTKRTHFNERPVGEWNRYDITVDGPRITLRVNGEVLNEAWDVREVPGKIGLQSEGAEIHFRNVRLRPLPSRRSPAGEGLGRPIFNGTDLGGWKCRGGVGTGEWRVAGAVELDPGDERRLRIEAGQGVLVNGAAGKTCDLVTEEEFGDCVLRLEFNIPRGSNSGVYVMGLYEVQIFDSFGKERPEFSDCGGIYARWINEQAVEGHAPRVNACRAPGAWQTYEIEFRAPRFDAAGKKVENARFVRVALNGQVVHENVELTGPTRAGLDRPEGPTGPLMLQGDHGPVAYRKIAVQPLEPR